MDLAGPWLLVLAATLAGLGLLAYSLRALDAAGAISSVLLGLAIALATGIGWILLMVCFSGLGVLATRAGYARKKRQRLAEEHGGERGLANVLGNGLAALLVALALPLGAPPLAVQAAFATAVAAVTADTLASEIGVLSARARMVVPPFARAAAGRNGAVSLLGQAAALVGSTAIALAAVPLIGLPWPWVWLPALAGWLGCQVDSVLGATLERDAEVPGRPLGKQGVNFLCGAVPAALVLAVGWVAWR